ncbi:MAG: glycosyl hydrolase [Hyphomicrobiales bacterium]|nr:glycosyl hydrolase [Hyphomicrobiales bacterium]
MIRAVHKKALAGAGLAGAISLAAMSIYQDEGERHRVYRDVVGVPTYCVGETRNPDWSRVYSHEDCMALLNGRLYEFAAAVQRCIHVPMSDARLASLINFSYNLGGGILCHAVGNKIICSTLATRLNANDPAACDAMLMYDRAGGRRIAGLHARRERNRAMCQQ